MTSIDPTSILGSEPLNPPPGLKLETKEQQELYRATLEFERFFVQQLLKPMQSAGSMFSDSDSGTGATAGYQDMAQDQLTQSVLDGGGLGMAAALYTQIADATGISTLDKTPAESTNETGGDKA